MGRFDPVWQPRVSNTSCQWHPPVTYETVLHFLVYRSPAFLWWQEQQRDSVPEITLHFSYHLATEVPALPYYTSSEESVSEFGYDLHGPESVGGPRGRQSVSLIAPWSYWPCSTEAAKAVELRASTAEVAGPPRRCHGSRTPVQKRGNRAGSLRWTVRGKRTTRFRNQCCSGTNDCWVMNFENTLGAYRKTILALRQYFRYNILRSSGRSVTFFGVSLARWSVLIPFRKCSRSV